MINSKKLSDIQNLFQESIRFNSTPEEINFVFVEKPPRSIQARLGVYQKAYQIRLIQSLRDDFPDFVQQVGDSKFESLANDFIRQHPSNSTNLAEYSEAFPEYIKRQFPQCYLPVLVEWVSILSESLQTAESSISLNEIQDSTCVQLAIHPTTILRHHSEKIFIVHRHKEQIEILEVDKHSELLFEALKYKPTFQDLEAFLIKNELDESWLSSVIYQWICLEIIYPQIINRGASL